MAGGWALRVDTGPHMNVTIHTPASIAGMKRAPCAGPCHARGLPRLLLAFTVAVFWCCAGAAPDEFPEGYFAICVAAKDQHKDLREWVEYYRYMGVKRIYLYDHQSHTPMRYLLEDYIRDGLVVYQEFSGRNQRVPHHFNTTDQYFMYQECYTRHARKHQFIGFLDVDEFVVLLSGARDVNKFLTQYVQYGGLALNWVFIGGSGHVHRPVGGVLVNYHKCFPPGHTEHRQVKVIANTDYSAGIAGDPHTLAYHNPRAHFTVNEVGEPVHGPRTAKPSHTKVALYHYVVKSDEDYRSKVNRGSAAGHHKTFTFATNVNAQCTDTCTRLVSVGYRCCPSVLAELSAQGLGGVPDQLVPWEVWH